MNRASALLLPFLAALLVLAWWLPNRPQADDVAMPDARFNSVSFAPYRAGESPLTQTFPTAAEVASDIALVARRAAAIRTYAAIEGKYDIAALARAHGLKLWQGIWLGQDRAQNAREIARGIAIANRYPDVVERVVVGNEVLLRRDLPVDELMADIDQVRRAVKQPVTYADVWEFWQKFPQVAAHVDIVTLHILPYWEDHPTAIGGAIDHVRDILARTGKLFPGKKLAIGETGWPSRGRWRQDAAPGVVNQAIFLRKFIALARQQGLDYNLIEAFDQVWKYQNEGTVGARWGLWNADRAPKFPLSGPVVENPDWPLDAGISVLLGLVLFGFTMAAVPPPPALKAPRHAGRLAVLAMATGGALGYAWAETTPDLYDIYLRIAGVTNLAGQTILAVLLMLRAAAILTGAPRPAPRSGAQATETVRALLCLRLTRLRGWQDWMLDDLSFVFLWTAMVLQLLLVADPRYRDFPLSTFAVPLLAVPARALLGDLPRRDGAREELVAGAVLAIGAVACAVQEGPLNLQSLAWNACALLLALPPLIRCGRRVRVLAPA
jgi:exo-beta-1,3-glucanase (GH17 family)